VGTYPHNGNSLDSVFEADGLAVGVLLHFGYCFDMWGSKLECTIVAIIVERDGQMLSLSRVENARLFMHPMLRHRFSAS
jgi:hypothetical protein